ncbi:efflux RND transporter periplasmic adaptor subunit [Clostridium carnis]
MNKKKINKKLILIILGSVIALAIVVFLGLKIKNQKNEALNLTTSTENLYEITGDSGVKFKGTSIVSKEQKIMMDKTSGDIEKVNVTDKQEVAKGDILFTYTNPAITEQVDGLSRQINSANEKAQRSSEKKTSFFNEKGRIASEALKLSNQIAANEKALSQAKDEDKAKIQEAITQLAGKKAELDQKSQVLDSKIEAEDAQIVTFKDSASDLTSQKDSLNSKAKKEVKADIDGIVYINQKGLTDPTAEYMRVVSKEPLVKADVSEFDVESLKVDTEVQIKVISNGDLIKGKITSIDELPTASMDGKSISYNFYIKPEKEIRVGFSVEVKIDKSNIQIPKEYVYENNSKLYVAKSKTSDKENPFEKVEIKATLQGENYILDDGDITLGDKLVKNPSEVLKEDN